MCVVPEKVRPLPFAFVLELEFLTGVLFTHWFGEQKLEIDPGLCIRDRWQGKEAVYLGHGQSLRSPTSALPVICYVTKFLCLLFHRA